MNEVTVLDQKTLKMKKEIISVIEYLKESNDSEKIRETYDQGRAWRSYYKTLGIVEEIRVELLQIEIICIVRLYDLGAELPKKVSEPMAVFFKTNGIDVNYYLKEYSNIFTALGIYKKYIKMQDLKNAFHAGVKAGFNKDNQTDKNLSESEIKNKSMSNYYDIQAAMKRIADELSVEGKSFTVSEMADKYFDEYNKKEISEEDGAYKEGLKEVCRYALRTTKIDTVGEREAPRYVTYIDSVLDEERFMRIPFEYATLDQLGHMIKFRELQLKQDSGSLENLKNILDDLLGMAGNQKTKRVGDILGVFRDGAA